MSPTAVRKPGATGIRAKQAQDTRAKILKAAVKVFAKQGTRAVASKVFRRLRVRTIG